MMNKRRKSWVVGNQRLRRSTKLTWVVLTLAVTLLAIYSPVTRAMPTDHTVVEGTATVEQINDLLLQITQETDKAILHWQDFSIEADGTVNFVQPNAESIALNRVIGDIPSTILGELTANGRIFLVNSNGILFGNNSQVDVAGLLATTLDIDDSDFLSGDFTFAADSEKAGYVINRGSITVDDNGFVYLVGASVDNSGLIVAKLGQVLLASGDSLTVDFDGSGLINFEVAGQISEAVKDPEGNDLQHLVGNQGTIESQGGQVILTGDAASDMVASVVNNSGIIRAQSLADSAGSVRLVGRGEGRLDSSGTIDVAREDGTAEGSVAITGQDIHLSGELLASEVMVDAYNDVEVDNDLALTAVDGTLSLRAARSVFINGDITTTDGKVEIIANRDTTPNLRESGSAKIEMGSSSQISVGDADILLAVADGLDAGYIHLAKLVSVGGLVTISTPGNIENQLVGDGVNVLADALDIRGKAIGSADKSLLTEVSILRANTSDGGIYLVEEDGLIIEQAIARENGNAPLPNAAGRVVIDPDTNTLGSHNVTIEAGGDLVLGSLAAPNKLTITAGGTIYDGLQDQNNLTARTLLLTAEGDIGQQNDLLETTADNITAVSGGGSIFLRDLTGTTFNSVSAGGADSQVVLSVRTGNARIGDITANQEVSVESERGSIIDENGSAVNISANRASLRAATGVGSNTQPIDTNVDQLSVVTTESEKVIAVNEQSGLSSVTVETQNGPVSISFSGGALTFTPSTSLLTLPAASGLSLDFTNARGNILQGGLSLGDTLVMNASGWIGSTGDNPISAGEITLVAGSYLGTLADPLRTNANQLVLQANNGGIFVQQDSAVTLTAISKGQDSEIRVENQGDMHLKQISAQGEVWLETTGGLVDANDDSLNITGTAAYLRAATGIGSSSDALETDVASLDARSSAGDINVTNRQALASLSAVASDGDVTITNTGNVSIGELLAQGHKVTLTASGDITAVDDDTVAVTALHADITARRIGQVGDKLQVAVAELVVETTNGGIYIYQPNVSSTHIISAKASGASGDISLTTRGNLSLGKVEALGSRVELVSETGAISDGRTTSGPNVEAKILEISAPGGIGDDNEPLEFKVSTLSASGGEGGVKAANLGSVFIDRNSLVGKGSSEIEITADQITILDMSGAPVVLDQGGTLILRAISGDIVFLNQDDTIDASGGGNVHFQAGWDSPGSGAVIIAGNLVTSEGGDITLQADSHITIGLLNAGYGEGDVRVESRNGIILDGNGVAPNIIANNVTLIGRTPSARDAELAREKAIADYYAKIAEAAAKQTTVDTWLANSLTLAAAASTAQINVDGARSIYNRTSADFKASEAKLNELYRTLQTASGIRLGAQTALNAAQFVWAAAQASPFGDFGASVVFAGLDLAFSVADMALWAAQMAYDKQDGTVSDLANELDVATANWYSARNNLDLANSAADGAYQALSIAEEAYGKAVVHRDHSGLVQEQAISAMDIANVIGSVNNPLGVTATRVDVTTFGESSVYLDSPGNLGLGDISPAGPGAEVVVQAEGNIDLIGTVQSPTHVDIRSNSGWINDGGGLIITPDLILVADEGIGGLDGITTQVSRLAALGGNGGVAIRNTGGMGLRSIDNDPLFVTDLGGVQGIIGAGDITLTTTGDLKLQSQIRDTTAASTVTLESIAGALVDDNGSGTNVEAGRLVAQASGDIDLDTRVAEILATSDLGSIVIREADSVFLEQAIAQAGPITITAGGDLVVGTITTSSDVVLASSGAIDDDQLNDTLITARNLDLTAVSGIGTNGTMETRALDTKIESLSASVTNRGDINIAEIDDLDIELATTVDGDITITSDSGNLQVTNVTAAGEDNTVTLAAWQGALTSSFDGLVPAISGSQLAVAAENGVTLIVAIDRLVADGGSGGVYLLNLDPNLTIGGVTPGLGLPMIQGLSTSDGSLLVDTKGDLVVNEAVTQSGQGRIFLVAGFLNESGDLRVNARIERNGTADEMFLAARDSIMLNADLLQVDDGNILLVAHDSIDMANGIAATIGGSGDISFNAQDGTIQMGKDSRIAVIELGDIKLEANNTITLSEVHTGEGDVYLRSTEGSITALDSRLENVIANTLFASSAAGIGSLDNPLYTRVGQLLGETTDVGAIVVNETDDIAVTELVTADGLIHVTAGGTITADLVSSNADQAANDITLVATDGGSIIVESIQAGSDYGTITLIGNLVTTNPTGRIIGDGLNVEANSGAELITAVNWANIEVDEGNISLVEQDDIRLQGVFTDDGRIDVDSGGSIFANYVLSGGTGESNDITLTALEDIQLSHVIAGLGADVNITAGGSISKLSMLRMPAVGVRGDRIALVAGEGIGIDGSPIDVAAAIISAITSTGDIFISEQDGVTIENLETSDGNIEFTTKSGGKHNLVIERMAAQGESGNVSLTSSGSSSVTVGIIDATGTVQIIADRGAIFGNELSTQITGAHLVLLAEHGIGAEGQGIYTNVDSIEATVTGSGDILLGEADDVTLRQLFTTDGNIYVVSMLGDLTVEDLVAEMEGSSINLAAVAGAINGTDSDTPHIEATSLQLHAAQGIGSSSNPLSVATSGLRADGGEGGIYLANTSDHLAIGDVLAPFGVIINHGLQVTGGDISLTTTGDLEINRDVTVLAGNGDITVNAGTIEQNADISTKGTGKILLNARLGDIIMDSSALTSVERGNIGYSAFGDLVVGSFVTHLTEHPGVHISLSAGNEIIDTNPEETSVQSNYIVLNTNGEEEGLVESLLGDHIPLRVMLNGRIAGGTLINPYTQVTVYTGDYLPGWDGFDSFDPWELEEELIISQLP